PECFFLFEAESPQKKIMFFRWRFLCDLLLSFQFPANPDSYREVILFIINSFLNLFSIQICSFFTIPIVIVTLELTPKSIPFQSLTQVKALCIHFYITIC